MAEGLSAECIAQHLHQEGYRPPKRQESFGKHGVLDLMHRLGLCPQRSCSQERVGLGEDEWWIPELARLLEMPDITLYAWIRRGWVKAYQREQPPRRWIIWADETEIERLRQHRQRPVGDTIRQYWRGEVPPIAASNQSTNSL